MSKITIDRAVVEQALEALFMYKPMVTGVTFQHGLDAMQALRAALEQPVEQELVAWQSIEAMAVQRYKVVPAHDSMFYRHAVVAGDGTQQLYIGRETECENIARKFAGAFLDGAYVASLYTHPQPKREPLTDEEIISMWEFPNDLSWMDSVVRLVRAIEAAHGIGGEK